MKKMFLILISGYLFTGTLFSQVDSLHENLLRQALEHNYQIQKAQLDIENSQSQVKQVRSYALPQISGSVDVKHYMAMPTVVIPGAMFGLNHDIETHLGRPNNGDAGITASNLIINQSFLYDLKTAKSSAELYKLLKIKTEDDVIYQLSYSYYYYLASMESLKILQENISILQENKTITTHLINNDMALSTDTSRIELRINELDKQENLLNSSLLEQKNRIKLLIGNENFIFPDSVRDIEHDYSNQAIELPDSTSRIDIQILEKQLAIQNLQIKKAKAAYIPTLSVYASYGYNAQQDNFKDVFQSDNWNNQSLVGVKATIPIFSGGRNNEKVQQAKLNYKIAETNLAMAKQNYNQEKKETFNKYFELKKNCEIQHKSIKLSEDIYKVSLLKYQKGILSLTDLLTASSDLSNAKLNYTKSLLDLYMAELDVLQSNGQLGSLIK